MWTNWEKLCSRIGPGGDVQCSIDPDRRVAPSAPFCAHRTARAPGEAHPLVEERARNRFCTRYSDVGTADRSARFCMHQSPDRPFNGRRIAALMQPGCDGLADAETGRPFCVSGGNEAGLADCAALAAAHYEHSRWLQCSHWSGEASCRAYPIMAPRLSGSATAFGALDPNLLPVHGLFCENK